MERALRYLQDHGTSKFAITPRWYIPWHELVVDYWSHASSGGFGRVYRAKWLGSDVAVKELTTGSSLISPDTSFVLSDDSGDASRNRLEDEDQATSEFAQDAQQRSFMSEVETWFQLSHPHVIRLYGACHVGTPRFVCEYAANGSLDKYLRKFPHQIWLKLHEAALGVQYLHERGIIHGDLKCNNIVVASDGAAKVTDFGLSSQAGSSDLFRPVSSASHWVAPECFHEQRPSFASDIYSFVMCLIESLRVVEGTMMNKTEQEHPRLPWQHLTGEAVKTHLKMHHIPSRPSVCTDDQWGLVKRMCCFDPSDRVKISLVAKELKKIAGADTDLLIPSVCESVAVKVPQRDSISSCAACGSKTSSKYPFCGQCGSTQRSLSAVHDRCGEWRTSIRHASR
jgi:serine/threonine protein kinase